MRLNDSTPASSLSALVAATAAPRRALLAHPVYEQLCELGGLRAFMGSHVFAVWDFMSLLKTLQRRLTCLEVPWLPPEDVECARMINEIVLGEETDEVRPGVYQSHFELYLEAMREVGADVGPVQRFVGALRRGRPWSEALEHAPEAAQGFVRNTLELTRGETHQVAAAFLFGREHLLPAVFDRVLRAVEPLGASCASLRLYLERHIQLDGEEHGARAEVLLCRLCGSAEQRWQEAQAAALSSLSARQALWGGVLRELGAMLDSPALASLQTAVPLRLEHPRPEGHHAPEVGQADLAIHLRMGNERGEQQVHLGVRLQVPGEQAGLHGWNDIVILPMQQQHRAGGRGRALR
jgi:hypothetical protein